MSSPIFQPEADPTSVPCRPINKGMVLNFPTAGLPVGALIRASNFIVGQEGPLRRLTLVEFVDASVAWPPVRELIQFWKANGDPCLIVLDSKFVYEVNIGAGTFTGKYMTISDGHATVAAAGTAVTGAGSLWAAGGTPANDVMSGDVIVFEPGTANEDAKEIGSVTDDTHLTLKAGATIGHTTVDYEIRKAICNADPYLVDWTFIPNKIVFADGQRYSTSYDGTTYEIYNSGLTFVPSCVVHFIDRLWFGRIVAAGVDYRNRFMWSQTTNKISFGSRFLDTPYTAGYMMRLVPLGSMLAAFFNDVIYVGRPTGVSGDTLPISFTRLDTAGVGLLGPKALCAWMEGIFWVGQDNVYFLSNQGNRPIGTPVMKSALLACKKPWAIYVEADPTNTRICFGFPVDGDEIERIWSYDYVAQSWSYDLMACSMLRRTSATSELTWSNWTGTDYATGTITAVAAADHVHGNSTAWQTATILAGAAIHIDVDKDGVYEIVHIVESNAADEAQLEIVGTVAATITTAPYYIVQPVNQWANIDAKYPTWFAVGKVQPSDVVLCVGLNSKLYVLSDTQTQDFGSSRVEAELIFPDWDEGEPDYDKTWLRFSARIDRVLSADLALTISFSLNAGQTWKSAGIIKIAAGYREGFVNFKATGSIIRFSLRTSSAVECFRVTEVTRRVVGRGVEVHTAD